MGRAKHLWNLVYEKFFFFILAGNLFLDALVTCSVA